MKVFGSEVYHSLCAGMVDFVMYSCIVTFVISNGGGGGDCRVNFAVVLYMLRHLTCLL